MNNYQYVNIIININCKEGCKCTAKEGINPLSILINMAVGIITIVKFIR